MAWNINDKRQIVLIAHNIRSIHNIGSLFRTAEGLGVNELVISGYSSYPREENDTRLPYLIEKLERQINKTALGAQDSLKWRHINDIKERIKEYKKNGYTVYALEQDVNSQDLAQLKPPDKLVLIVGNELTGIENDILPLTDQIIEIAMLGRKESFNVVQAAAMALFYLRFS